MPHSALAWRACIVGAVAALAVGISAVVGGARPAGAEEVKPVAMVRTARYVIGDYVGFAIGVKREERRTTTAANRQSSRLARRQRMIRTAVEVLAADMCRACARPLGASWRGLVNDLAGENSERQLAAVNRFFNRVSYAEDRDVYGAKDYWATPAEFLRRNAGDCEDFAVAKYTALRALGWSADSLLVVAIRDHEHNVDHAVLAAKLNGQWYYLDNRSAQLLKPRQVRYYQPIYALNERGHSVFVKSGSTRRASVGNRSYGDIFLRAG